MSSRPLYTLETVNNVLCRRVAPYIQEFETYAKGRWLGREFLEVLCREFGGQPASYWRAAIRSGNVTINGRIIEETYRFQNSDKFLHRTHRHEPPVFGSVELVGETSELFAVSKPSSMPMHPSGAYCHNSLENILRYDPLVENQPQLFLVHRLDKVTSGLVVLAKNKATAAVVAEEIRNKTTKKVYLAKVRGRFPRRLDQLRQCSDVRTLFSGADDDEDENNDNGNGEEKRKKKRKFAAEAEGPGLVSVCPFEELCAAPQVSFARESVPFSLSSAHSDSSHVKNADNNNDGDNSDEKSVQGGSVDKWTVSCPIGVVSFRDGVYCCHPRGKASVSSFVCLGYDENADVSLVLCLPHTGRTHQLRLHLELCGNPIANDPCYGGELFFGEKEKRDAAIAAVEKMRAQGYHPLSKMPHLRSLGMGVSVTDSHHGTCSTNEGEHKTVEETESLARLPNETDEEYTIRHCRYCKIDNEAEKLEGALHCDGIWLHALQYSSKSDWKFRAPIPSWATEYSSQIEAIMGKVDDGTL